MTGILARYDIVDIDIKQACDFQVGPGNQGTFPLAGSINLGFTIGIIPSQRCGQRGCLTGSTKHLAAQ
jgi:hypothetical protein